MDTSNFIAMVDQYVIIDRIKWWVYIKTSGGRGAQPTCPIHFIRLYPVKEPYKFLRESTSLSCAECKHLHRIPRQWDDEEQYVLDKTESKIIKGIRFINLDDEAVPIAEGKISKDSKYFVKSVLTKSKVGLRLVVYAGESGKKEKTQIFVEPEIRRLAFDQTNLHPTDVFAKLEATFSDGTKASIEKKK